MTPDSAQSRTETRLLVNCLRRKAGIKPPVWLMRQAGRYLPEYHTVRDRAGSFWELCHNPELAAEVTLQPVRRFGFDAAIVFSDILTVPAALGYAVDFSSGKPVLQVAGPENRFETDTDIQRERLQAVCNTLSLVRSELDPDTSLLGFAGAPWTLACYMAAGCGDEGKAAKLWAYRHPQSFDALITALTDCVALSLTEQLRAGADAVQLFDSSAGNLRPDFFARYVIAPAKRIVEKVRHAIPDAKIIGFPRLASLDGYRLYGAETGVDCVSLDTSVSLNWARQALPGVVLQGNLDPLALIAGGDTLVRQVAEIMEATQGCPHIFNLGHGILPETPVAHVEKMLRLIRG